MPSPRTFLEISPEIVIQLHVTPYQELLTGPVRPVLYALLGALVLVLLIACANVSNLLIARCLGRQQEFAIRTALGARRTRLVRQMLSEGLMLSLLGCGAGLLLAQLAMIGIRKLPDGTIPRADSIAIHWTIVLALGAIAVLTTVLSSLLTRPAGGASESASRAASGFPGHRLADGRREAQRRTGRCRGCAFHAAAGRNGPAVPHAMEPAKVAPWFPNRSCHHVHRHAGGFRGIFLHGGLRGHEPCSSFGRSTDLPASARADTPCTGRGERCPCHRTATFMDGHEYGFRDRRPGKGSLESCKRPCHRGEWGLRPNAGHATHTRTHDQRR